MSISTVALANIRVPVFEHPDIVQMVSYHLIMSHIQRIMGCHILELWVEVQNTIVGAVPESDTKKLQFWQSGFTSTSFPGMFAGLCPCF